MAGWRGRVVDLEWRAAVATPGLIVFFFLSSRRRHTRFDCDWSSDVCSSDLVVSTRRMKSEKRSRIDFYQDQVGDVLGRLFGATPGPSTEVMLSSQNPVFAEGLAVARMALDQAQQALNRTDETSEEVKALKAAYDGRLSALEARLLPRAQISEEQAEHISDMVKQVAIAMAKKLGGGNFFGTVFGQLYRTFNVTSYKLLTQEQYPKAVEWLQKQIKTYES